MVLVLPTAGQTASPFKRPFTSLPEALQIRVMRHYFALEGELGRAHFRRTNAAGFSILTIIARSRLLYYITGDAHSWLLEARLARQRRVEILQRDINAALDALEAA